MEAMDDDEDLKLIKASAGLLSELESDLPKVLWRSPNNDGVDGYRVAHSRIKKRDLDGIVSLIEPFQGEPQLLDAKLKTIVPQLVDAYLQYLSRGPARPGGRHVDFESAVCRLLYTLCKVRGYKVIVGFFNNEPRFFMPILQALERTCTSNGGKPELWQIQYVQMLWLSHLLLTPFDLVSISSEATTVDQDLLPEDCKQLPPLMLRILQLGLRTLSSSTKVQEPTATMLARFFTRPDVLRLQVADSLVTAQLQKLQLTDPEGKTKVYETLGCLRFLAKVASSAELSHLIPHVYHSCEALSRADGDGAVASNAVAKKIMIKIFRNISILSLRSLASSGPLPSFLDETGALEGTIEYLLQSLADQDTPVRYAAAKAMSLMVTEFETAMGHEVVQAVLDEFKADLPRSNAPVNFATTDPLKWHGLTLALSHTLFTRSASPQQIPDILLALMSASRFHQRTATGTALGTNVRDAANFGIWSLSRRYITADLLAVPVDGSIFKSDLADNPSVIQGLATHLLLSACLDPAGNIRRGSSAAFQELIGRHPDQVFEGISLVQIVDYQAVGLRHRAMVDVANRAARLHETYRRSLLDGLLGWRGLGSSDVPAREGTAESISQLAASSSVNQYLAILQQILELLEQCPVREVEDLHGLTLIAARLVNGLPSNSFQKTVTSPSILSQLLRRLWGIGGKLHQTFIEFSSRTARAELPASVSRYMSAVYRVTLRATTDDRPMADIGELPWSPFENITERLLIRHEDWITNTIPGLVLSQLELKQRASVSLGCIDHRYLIEKVSVDCSKSTMHGSGRAIALAVLSPLYGSNGSDTENASAAISTLTGLLSAPNVEWRILGARALQLLIEYSARRQDVSEDVSNALAHAICQGLRDYTIDERGDIGSLVRLQAITCASRLLSSDAFRCHETRLRDLRAGIYRLSMEKLDRVRLQAALCRHQCLSLSHVVTDVASVSSLDFFAAATEPLGSDAPTWIKQAVLEGCISSCSVSSAESVIQASRSALASHMEIMGHDRVAEVMDLFAKILKTQLGSSGANLQPALELLGFLLDIRLIQEVQTIKWRNLLSLVQRSHYKSNDVPKILAAVHVYAGLAEIDGIRGEALKKLVAMLKTNPYPRVRIATAEALWCCTGETELQLCDWTKPAARQGEVITHLQRMYVVQDHTGEG